MSAGLGLIRAVQRIPSYSFTVTPGTLDNVLSRISDSPSAAQWWRHLLEVSPFGHRFEALGRERDGPILVALPAGYLNMVADDLLALPERTRRQLRLFCLAPRSALVNDLQPYLLPYDDRFDGSDSPKPGTRADFAQRALSHFVEVILPQTPGASIEEHVEATDRILAKLSPAETPMRRKASDLEITHLIQQRWGHVRGQSGKMLRHLRDDLGIACEQGRFRDLFRAAKERQ